MLLRLLLLAILIFLLVRFVVRLGRLAAAALREGSAPAAPTQSAVPLVPCRRCGVFVPRSLATAGSSDGFLCRACAGAGG